MSSYLSGARSARRTPQTEPIFGREEEMVKNAAGGYAFEIDALARLRRFLILGAEGGTYYAGQREHVKENVHAVEQALRQEGVRAVATIIDISVNGRAAKQDPVIWSLARAASHKVDPNVMAMALEAVPAVCRTGYQLFLFAEFVTEMRGWGPSLRRAVAAWYEQRGDICPECGGRFVTAQSDAVRAQVKTMTCANGHQTQARDLPRGVDGLAYQMIKYRSRLGSRRGDRQPWTHKRLIQLSHPKPPTPEHEALYRWAVGKDPAFLPEKVEGFRWAQLAATPAETARVIRDRPWLPWEAVKSEHTTDADVWRALIDTRMPLGAMLRNLGRMTSYGVLKPLDPYAMQVARRLTDERELKRARIHPLEVLKAQLTYGRGQGARTRWEPVRAINDALDEAFYAAFGSVEPAGKRMLLAIDVSGSMTGHDVAGIEGLSARAGAAVMALVTAAREPMHEIVAFSANRAVSGAVYHPLRGYVAGPPDPEFYDPQSPQDYAIRPLDITPRMRLPEAIEVMRKTPAGGTDISLPFRYAIKKGLSVDTFVVYTDNESYAGRVHPAQALQNYRESTGIRDARLVVVALSATGYSVADPRDPGMLDVVGFDTAAPGLISAFARGEV